MNNRTLPQYNMDNIQISRLAELKDHLLQATSDPSMPFDAKLIDHVELQLTEANTPPLLPEFLPLLAEILLSTTQDPTSLLSFSVKMLQPLTFSRALAIANPPTLLMALKSPLTGANKLALSIIQKASKSPSDTSELSTLTEVVEALIDTWLNSADVGVGELAARVLGDLLETDCELTTNVSHDALHTSVNGDGVTRSAPGHGGLWRLILQSRESLLQIRKGCSCGDAAELRTPYQVTISQGRLLRLLPRLCTMNILALSHPAHRDLFDLPESIALQIGEGLLQWATLGMVDTSDSLMQLSLLDFFERFVSLMRISRRTTDVDALIKALVNTAMQKYDGLQVSLSTLPNRTIEDEAEDLRAYIKIIMG